MGSIDLTGLTDGGESCSDEDESAVLARAELEHRLCSFDSQNWIPRARSFRPFACRTTGPAVAAGDLQQQRGGGPGSLRVDGTRPLVKSLTTHVVETYRICNPGLLVSSDLPKRCLTNPSAAVRNDGQDNENSDLVVHVDDVLANGAENRRYTVKGMLGQGTFGQVFKCWSPDMRSDVAVKVIKNQPAFYQQAQVEISICNLLNNRDRSEKSRVVRIYDHFLFAGHLCLVFELLDENLYEMLKINNHKGLSMKSVRLFTIQILESLMALRDAGVIHCDLKPENILLQDSLRSLDIKLIDFGSACLETRTVYKYIQSRFYRSPEVLLHHPYTTAIDMWSLGCVAAELFLGIPLFPGECEYDLLQRMMTVLGYQPPDSVLNSAKRTAEFFERVDASGQHTRDGHRRVFQFRSAEEYELKAKRKPKFGKQYFDDKELEEIILAYPLRKKVSPEEREQERRQRICFIDFLNGVLQFDPLKRWTPGQAAQHPFITGTPFVSTFKPPPEMTRHHIGHGLTVDHNPGAGHWVGVGLSLQVGGSVLGQYNPGYHVAPFSSTSSHSSVSSYGSCEGGNGFGSSMGSYGDGQGIYFSYPTAPGTGMNGYHQTVPAGRSLGVAPDEAQRIMHGTNVPTNLGMSPSGHQQLVGSGPSHNFQPSPGSAMSGSAMPDIHSLAIPFATSPSSNYHGSPATHFLASPGSPSHSSSNWHGPTSPARLGASSLGKIAHYNNHNCSKRRPWPPAAANSLNHDITASHGQRLQQQNASGSDSVANGIGVHGPSSVLRRQRNGVAGPQLLPASNLYAPGSLGALLNTPESDFENGHLSPPPDPRDWDPSYSDELLLEGNPVELSNSSVSAMDLAEVCNGVARVATGSHSYPGQGVGSRVEGSHHGRNITSDIQNRLNATIQGQQCVEESSGPLHQNSTPLQGQNHPHYSQNSQLHGAYSHANALQNSPSRLGLQPPPYSQQQLLQLQSHHMSLQLSQSASLSTGSVGGQPIGVYGNNIPYGPLPPMHGDPRAMLPQGCRMMGPNGPGTIMGCTPSGYGVQYIPPSFIPNVDPMSHHLVAGPNFSPWGQNGYNQPHGQTVVPHESYSMGRQTCPTMTAKPPPAPGRTYANRRA